MYWQGSCYAQLCVSSKYMRKECNPLKPIAQVGLAPHIFTALYVCHCLTLYVLHCECDLEKK